MNPSLLTFFSWAALTYYWLTANVIFYVAIAQAIEDHNDTMRAQGVAMPVMLAQHRKKAKEEKEEEKD